MTPRAWLFVPGDRPDRMEKALRSGAEALILDLEDLVARSAKAAARRAVRDFLGHATDAGPQLWVRINPLSGGLGADDLEAVIGGAPSGLVLPKATPPAVACLGERLSALEDRSGATIGATRILPVATETPAAVFQLQQYAAYADRLAGLTWGAEDLSAAVGAVGPRDETGRLTPVYDIVRALTLLAAAAAGVNAVETVYPDFRDRDGLAAYAARGRRDGFVGMMAIHAAQVPVINAGFLPSEVELARARAIAAAFDGQIGAGVVSLDGKMLDAPHLAQARRVLDRAPLSVEDSI